MLQTMSALSKKNSGLKNDEVSKWGDVRIIVSCMRILLWLEMWREPVIDWIKLIFKKKKNWIQKRRVVERKRVNMRRVWAGEKKLGEKEAVLWRARVGTKERGQRARMYGHGLGNVTERVRKREGQKTNWVHFSRHWREAFHCQNYNSRFSDGDITSAGGNFV